MPSPLLDTWIHSSCFKTGVPAKPVLWVHFLNPQKYSPLLTLSVRKFQFHDPKELYRITNLKCTRGVVHTVNSQIVIQRVAGHAAKDCHLELFHSTVCDWLSCKGIGPKAIKEHVTCKGIQKTVTGCGFILH